MGARGTQPKRVANFCASLWPFRAGIGFTRAVALGAKAASFASMKAARWLILLSLLGGALALALPAADDFAASVAGERAQRLERLTKPDGWLTLVGLHFLPDGESTVGRAPENAVVLSAGPAKLGRVARGADGRVTFQPEAGAEVLVDGQPASHAELRPGSGERKPTLITAGTLSLFVIERDGRQALRVRDSASARRKNFLGLEYYAADPAWRIEAEWVPFDPPREVPIVNILGKSSPSKVTGKAVFTHDGKTVELWPLDEAPGEPLFLIFADTTSEDETYAMRFLAVPPPKDGKVILDFNLAVNPPCAFTPWATCPLPPRQNRLPFAVKAGEKKYRGREE